MARSRKPQRRGQMIFSNVGGSPVLDKHIFASAAQNKAEHKPTEPTRDSKLSERVTAEEMSRPPEKQTPPIKQDEVTTAMALARSGSTLDFISDIDHIRYLNQTNKLMQRMIASEEPTLQSMAEPFGPLRKFLTDRQEQNLKVSAKPENIDRKMSKHLYDLAIVVEGYFSTDEITIEDLTDAINAFEDESANSLTEEKLGVAPKGGVLYLIDNLRLKIEALQFLAEHDHSATATPAPKSAASIASQPLDDLSARYIAESHIANPELAAREEAAGSASDAEEEDSASFESSSSSSAKGASASASTSRSESTSHKSDIEVKSSAPVTSAMPELPSIPAIIIGTPPATAAVTPPAAAAVTPPAAAAVTPPAPAAVTPPAAATSAVGTESTDDSSDADTTVKPQAKDSPKGIKAATPKADAEEESSASSKSETSDEASDESASDKKASTFFYTKAKAAINKAKVGFDGLKKQANDFIEKAKKKHSDAEESSESSSEDDELTDAKSALSKLAAKIQAQPDGELKNAFIAIHDMASNDLDNNKDIHTAALACDKTSNLIDTLSDSNMDDAAKKASVKRYVKDMSSSRFERFWKAVAVVALAAAGFILGAAVGTGIGVAVGSWTGPGAAATAVAGLFTGAATGAAAGLLAGSVATGLTASAVGAGLLFKPTKLQKAVAKVGEEARAEIRKSSAPSI